jgi:5-methyltetrahydrofolate--homocysteine methyltransferase
MLDMIAKAVEEYDQDNIEAYVKAAKASGLSAKDILDNGFLKGMDALGKRFSAGQVFVPEVLMAANTMQAGVALIKDELMSTGNCGNRGVVVIGTVKGDLHDIGKKLVAMMIEGAGYTIYDLGIDVPVEEFVRAAREYKADFVGLSALLTTTMTEMKDVITALKAAGIKAEVLIGGAPVSEQFADRIGAHYSSNAAEAVELVNRLAAKRT